MVLKARKTGFTLVELVVSIAIIGIFFGMTVIRYGSYNDKQKVEQAALNLITDMQKVRAEAIAGKKPDVAGCSTTEPFEGYTITFSDVAYTITPRCNGVNVTAGDVVKTLPDGIAFSPIPSPASFTYYSLTGKITDAPTEVVLVKENTQITLKIEGTTGNFLR